MAIRMERTGEFYRGATGTSEMEVRIVGGSWDEMFEELQRHPKEWYEMPTDAFVGIQMVGGKEIRRTPSVGVIQRELDRQAWYYGLVLGFQDVMDDHGKPRKDRFRVCMRTTDIDGIRVPKRIRELDLSEEEFGVKA